MMVVMKTKEKTAAAETRSAAADAKAAAAENGIEAGRGAKTETGTMTLS